MPYPTFQTSLNGHELAAMNEELSSIILAWAKEHHPEKYDQTIKMSRHPAMFLKYLTRLVEIRWETDLKFRSEAPLHVLEETSIVARFTDKRTGSIIEVKGRTATGGRTWGFKELSNLKRDSFDELKLLKDSLDLELVPE